MPQPTTAAEIEMAMEMFKADRYRMAQIVRSTFSNIFDYAFNRLYPPRPHTDDMVQMIVDLGIEPQEQDFRDLSFSWRR